MNHTITALFVPALVAVLVPLGVLNQFFKGWDVSFLQEITGLLPAEDVVGRIAPGRALVIDVALKELKEVGGKVEFPGFFPVGEDLMEEFFGAFAT